MTRRAELFAVVFCCWITFPLLALWLMLTHPGKCALAWKRELSGTWFISNNARPSGDGKGGAT